MTTKRKKTRQYNGQYNEKKKTDNTMVKRKRQTNTDNTMVKRKRQTIQWSKEKDRQYKEKKGK